MKVSRRMFQILEIGLDGLVSIHEVARVEPPPEGVIRWVDLSV